MSIVDDFRNRIGTLLGGVGHALSQDVQQVGNYFNPQSNGGNNFWSTPVAQGLAGAQQGIQNIANNPAPLQVRMPQIQTHNTAGNFLTNLPGNLISGALNSPGQYIQGIARTGQQIGQGNFNPKQLAGNLAETASLPLMFAGGGAAKSALGEGGSLFMRALQGMKTGAAYGGGFGAVQGLQSGADIKNNADYVKNLAVNTAGGAVMGGALGAGIPVAGEGISKLMDNPGMKPGFAKLGKKGTPLLSPTEAGGVVKGAEGGVTPILSEQRAGLNLGDVKQVNDFLKIKGVIVENSGKDVATIKIPQNLIDTLGINKNGMTLKNGYYQIDRPGALFNIHGDKTTLAQAIQVKEAKVAEQLHNQSIDANLTPEQARQNFQKQWAETYGNRPTTTKIAKPISQPPLGAQGGVDITKAGSSFVEDLKKWPDAKTFIKEHYSYEDNPKVAQAFDELAIGDKIKWDYTEGSFGSKIQGFLGKVTLPDGSTKLVSTKTELFDLAKQYGTPIEKALSQPPLGEVSSSVRNPAATGNTMEAQLGSKLPAQGGKATTIGETPTQLSSKLSATGGGPLDNQISSSLGGIVPPGANQPPTDPVQKIIQALKGAKPIRAEQQALYSKAMAQRTARVAAMGSKVPGEQGYFAQLGQLKGQLPKAQFEGIRGQLTQSDIDSLFSQVENANISPLEKVTAKGGLANLLGKEGGQVPTRSELSLLNEIFPPEFTQAILDKRSGWQKFLQGAGDVLSVPRSLMASFDLSAPLRQGALIGPSHPKEYAGAFGNMFRYAVSEKAYQGMLQDISSRPTYQAMRQSGLAITGKATPLLNQREEAFMSNLAERIPGVGHIVRASDRAYTGFLNKLRADTFDTLWNNAKSNGTATPDVANGLATFINTATGRGELGALNRAGGVLSTALFSPRLLASRIQTMNPLYYTSLPPQARQEALKALVTFGGTALTLLGLAKMGGASVGADPRNADFGKIKVGNTRYDILAGFQQPIRLAAQLITGKSISSTTGKEITLGSGYGVPTRKDLLLRFFESKESPVASFIGGILTGSNNIGQPFNIPAEVINRFIPMVAQDMYDLAKDKNSPLATLMGIPGVFGVGVQTYGKQIPNLQTSPAGKLSVKLSPLPGLSEDIVNKITGQQPSNVPLDQQQGLVSSKMQATQNSVDVAKVKSQLQSGGNVDKSVQQATYNIDGAPQQGYQVGKNFIYIDANGDTQSKTVAQLQKGDVSYKESLIGAQMTQAKNNNDTQTWYTLAQQLQQSYMTQLQDHTISPLDKVKLENKLVSLAKSMDKYKSYGGFKKGKKLSLAGLKVRSVKAPSVKSAKSRQIKLSTPKFKSIRVSRPSAQLMSGVVR